MMHEGHDVFSETEYKEYLVGCQSKKNTALCLLLAPPSCHVDLSRRSLGVVGSLGEVGSLSDGGSSVLYLLLCDIITGLCLESGEG